MDTARIDGPWNEQVKLNGCPSSNVVFGYGLTIVVETPVELETKLSNFWNKRCQVKGSVIIYDTLKWKALLKKKRSILLALNAKSKILKTEC